MSVKYLTHEAVIRCTHGGLLQLIPPLNRSLYSGGSPVIVRPDLFAGTIIACPEPFKPCISIKAIVAGLAEKTIVDGEIPILMTLQALTDGGAFCSAVFDPVTRLETGSGAVPMISNPTTSRDGWWRGQWNDFLQMLSDPASLTGIGVALLLAILALIFIPAELAGLVLALFTLGLAALIGLLSALASAIVSNLVNGLPWNADLLRRMQQGASICMAFAAAGLVCEAAGLAVGSARFIAAMAAAGAGIGIISNELTGRPWDRSLLANIGLSGAFAAIGKYLPRSQTPRDLESDNPTLQLSTFAKYSGILRDASAGRGNFGLGDVTAAESKELGEAWVGPGAKMASDGKTLISADGLRQYRPSSFKPKLGKVQANLESRNAPEGRWSSNGHLDIK